MGYECGMVMLLNLKSARNVYMRTRPMSSRPLVQMAHLPLKDREGGRRGCRFKFHSVCKLPIKTMYM